MKGSASTEDLDALCASARAVIVYQQFGGGALTRIADMLLAGVPVLANAIAARSYHGCPGVYEYNAPEELAALLATDLPEPPLPVRPHAAERRFVETVRQLLDVS